MLMEIKRLEDFIKNMPEDIMGNIPKARYLYLELGKRSFYDPEYKYFMFGEAEDDIRYVSKQYSNPNIVICTTLAAQYCTLLDMAKIPNIIEYESGAHCFNIFQDENGKEHEADLTQDLKNIQFGCRTNYFGLGTIESEELRKIDTSLGYISEERGYSDEYWHIIKDAIQDERLSPKKRLELIFANLHRLGDIRKPRYGRIV